MEVKAAQRGRSHPRAGFRLSKSLRGGGFLCPARLTLGVCLLHAGKGSSEIHTPGRDEDRTEGAVAPVAGTPGDATQVQRKHGVQGLLMVTQTLLPVNMATIGSQDKQSHLSLWGHFLRDTESNFKK